MATGPKKKPVPNLIKADVPIASQVGKAHYVPLAKLLGQMGWVNVQCTVDQDLANNELVLALTARSNLKLASQPPMLIEGAQFEEPEKEEAEEEPSYNVDMLVHDMEEATKKAIQDELFITPHDQTHAAPGSIADMIWEIHEQLLTDFYPKEMQADDKTPMEKLKDIAVYLGHTEGVGIYTSAIHTLTTGISEMGAALAGEGVVKGSAWSAFHEAIDDEE